MPKRTKADHIDIKKISTLAALDSSNLLNVPGYCEAWEQILNGQEKAGGTDEVLEILEAKILPGCSNASELPIAKIN